MRRTTGFTLIEMLTVLVIMGIVLAIGLPAFTTLMKSGGLNSASRQVSSTLSLARQYAITHRTTTRVVFPYRLTIGVGTNQAPPYQSYAVLEFGSITNYLSKWELLPLGTVFMDSQPILGNPPLSRRCLDNLGTATFPFPGTNFPSTTPLAYIEFRPTGAASQTGTFTATEGVIIGGVVTPTSRSAGALANVVTVSVDSVVGRIRVDRP